MNRSRLIQLTSLAVISVFSIFLVFSCNKSAKYNDTTLIRPCDNVICLNGGVCKDGVCSCPQGFEGTQCQTKWSDKFLGNYLADDACDTSSNYYSVVINADPQYAYKLRIYHLGLNCKDSLLYATINPEKTSFVIPVQHTCGSLYISGSGNLNNKYINVYLYTRDSSMHTGSSCSILLNRQ